MSNVQIDSRNMKFGIPASDQRYLKFFWSLINQALLELSQLLLNNLATAIIEG